MLTVKSHPLELRGVAHRNKKDGGVYYIVNVEEEDGTSHSLYCPKAENLAAGLKKGDMVSVLFDVYNFQGNDRLVVKNVSKVN